jgi:hypothetical protein
MSKSAFAASLLVVVSHSARAAETRFEKDAAIESPIASGNLAVFPLTPKGSVDDANYLTLDEAFKAKVLAIKEMGEGGSVNTLLVSNSGDKPVYVMAGELLLGGKQDRIMGQSTVIPPKAARMEVAVFCVEHGRWSGATNGFESGDTLSHATLRKKALFQGQGEVWDEVSRSNDKLHTKTDTDTYRKAAKKLEGDIASRKKEILSALDKVPKASGFAVAISGKVVGVEFFRSPVLFGKLREKLIGSYVAESLAVTDTGKHADATAKDVVAFMTNAEQAPKVREKKSPQAKSLDFSSSFVDGELVIPKGATQPVQSSYFQH